MCYTSQILLLGTLVVHSLDILLAPSGSALALEGSRHPLTDGCRRRKGLATLAQLGTL